MIRQIQFSQNFKLARVVEIARKEGEGEGEEEKEKEEKEEE